MVHLFRRLEVFWTRHPALLYSFALLLAIFLTLSFHMILILPLFFLFWPLLSFKEENSHLKMRLILALGMGIILSSYISQHYSFPDLPKAGVWGVARLKVSYIEKKLGQRGYKWIYKGILESFYSEKFDKSIRHAPYTLSFHENFFSERPEANQDYCVNCRLRKTEFGRYYLQLTHTSTWRQIPGTWSLAEIRFKVKNKVRQYILKMVGDAHSANFLSGLATGNFDDEDLVSEFNRFGLQHILAISGFHFAIIALFLRFLLKTVFSIQISCVLLILCLSGYFLFLGTSYSVMRAWIMSLIFFAEPLVSRKGVALNSLGLAILLILLWDPLAALNLGFQFSSVATAGILMFFHHFESILRYMIPKRTLDSMIEMSWTDQHIYIVLTWIRQALALTCAVNLVTVPITLYYFHQFPISSLVYNLFFPFLVSISMILLLLGFLFSFIPFLGEAIFSLNTVFTNWMLRFTFEIPTSLDLMWRVEGIPLEWIVIYLSLLIGLKICHPYHNGLKTIS